MSRTGGTGAGQVGCSPAHRFGGRCGQSGLSRENWFVRLWNEAQIRHSFFLICKPVGCWPGLVPLWPRHVSSRDPLSLPTEPGLKAGSACLPPHPTVTGGLRLPHRGDLGVSRQYVLWGCRSYSGFHILSALSWVLLQVPITQNSSPLPHVYLGCLRPRGESLAGHPAQAGRGWLVSSVLTLWLWPYQQGLVTLPLPAPSWGCWHPPPELLAAQPP